MSRASIAEARVFAAWRNFQEALTRTLAPLTEAQLGLRLRADLRSVGAVAEHIAYGRALMLHHIQADGAGSDPVVGLGRAPRPTAPRG